MSTCIVCSNITTKYKCPRCFERYCSAACCKAHKESCTQQKQDVARQSPQAIQKNSDFKEPQLEAPRGEADTDSDQDADKVPNELLQMLGESTELRSTLSNPHLRAILENLVNTDQSDKAIAQAMQEPIFTEFADICLQIVDRDNPNLIEEEVS